MASESRGLDTDADMSRRFVSPQETRKRCPISPAGSTRSTPESQAGRSSPRDRPLHSRGIIFPSSARPSDSSYTTWTHATLHYRGYRFRPNYLHDIRSQAQPIESGYTNPLAAARVSSRLLHPLTEEVMHEVIGRKPLDCWGSRANQARRAIEYMLHLSTYGTKTLHVAGPRRSTYSTGVTVRPRRGRHDELFFVSNRIPMKLISWIIVSLELEAEEKAWRSSVDWQNGSSCARENGDRSAGYGYVTGVQPRPAGGISDRSVMSVM